jgi:hypothetical protein
VRDAQVVDCGTGCGFQVTTIAFAPGPAMVRSENGYLNDTVSIDVTDPSGRRNQHHHADLASVIVERSPQLSRVRAQRRVRPVGSARLAGQQRARECRGGESSADAEEGNGGRPDPAKSRKPCRHTGGKPGRRRAEDQQAVSLTHPLSS